jgi:hypothetical protein
MANYRYKYGDRPLDGYTIHRAAGRGGFGEVYFAVSDSGREVAIKSVHGMAAVELRGIRQCMNLKSPHLVSIFDVRSNAEGDPFVIMEFVKGPSLQELLEQSPGGLGPAKTAFFLREIAKGLSYLHDSGIVHRDLKPGNIFYEDGYVKIGDYGLSKSMAADQRSNQTVTVGTVHYMAPEVGDGRYDRGIDIYALGVLTYEMLTGELPFNGQSPAEILIKHATAPVNTAKLDQPYARVIRKAMAKNPDDRYATVQELVEDVFGSEQVRESLSTFAPSELSMVSAQLHRQRATIPPPEPPVAVMTPPAAPLSASRPDVVAAPRGKFSDIVERGRVVRARPADPIALPWRVALAVLGVATLTVLSIVLTGGGAAAVTMAVGAMIGGCVAAAFGPGIMSRRQHDGPFMQRLLVGGTAATGVLLTAAAADQVGIIPSTTVAVGPIVALMLLNWSKAIDPARRRRVSGWVAVGVGLLAVLIGMFASKDATLGAFVAMATVICAQALSPLNVTASRLPMDARRRAADARRQAEHRADGAEPRLLPPGPSIAAGQMPDHAELARYVSPAHRGWALLLCAGWFLGISGLQRFYVGKFVTGFIWLLTGGLFGIGQIIDVILIVSGSFRDGYGRRLITWLSADELAKLDGNELSQLRHDAADTDRNTPRPHPFFERLAGTRWFAERGASALLALPGYVMLLVGLLAAGAMVLDIPAMFAAGIPDRTIDQAMINLLNMQDWPTLAHRLLDVPAALMMAFGALIITMSRWRSRWWHTAIPLVTLIGLIVSYAMVMGMYDLRNAWVRAAASLEVSQVGGAINHVLDGLANGNVLLALPLAIVSLGLLLVPSRGVPTDALAVTDTPGERA